MCSRLHNRHRLEMPSCSPNKFQLVVFESHDKIRSRVRHHHQAYMRYDNLSLSFFSRSPTASLPPCSPARHNLLDVNSKTKLSGDPTLSAVRAAFENALAPTSTPQRGLNVGSDAFRSLGDDTLGEERFPSNIGSRVSSLRDDLHLGLHLVSDSGVSVSQCEERTSESSVELVKKKVSAAVVFLVVCVCVCVCQIYYLQLTCAGYPHQCVSFQTVTFGNLAGCSSHPVASSPIKVGPNNQAYSKRGIQLHKVDSDNDSYV